MCTNRKCRNRKDTTCTHIARTTENRTGDQSEYSILASKFRWIWIEINWNKPNESKSRSQWPIRIARVRECGIRTFNNETIDRQWWMDCELWHRRMRDSFVFRCFNSRPERRRKRSAFIRLIVIKKTSTISFVLSLRSAYVANRTNTKQNSYFLMQSYVFLQLSSRWVIVHETMSTQTLLHWFARAILLDSVCIS